ncbi:hypothetical protein TH61_08560 [Rufibacter sp. DG15C]|uniref:hypothetical protein n=1 Tax=Rufibacter sp. DG15C TaxID=1379909 RepID=UPI00078E70FB|nr:hypothetical protein [Rufibacter sp. DG15C]AMM51217.1 hypothetical protein TH61_08560 [Rufibacter sp. DG15C]
MQGNILRLTGVIQPGLTKGVYVGHIKEISGIISQGSTEQEAFDKLFSIVPIMLEEKKEEARKLFHQQYSPVQEALNPETSELHVQLIKEVHEA